MNHNTYGYERGCRCDICRAAVAAATRRLRARKRRNQIHRHPPDEVRQHLLALRELGFTWNAIDKASGYRWSQRIGTGETKWVTPKTADLLLGLTVSDLIKTPGVLKPSRETFRQIEEICAAGWSFERIKRETGYIPQSVKDRCPRVWPATQAKVQALHDRLWRENTDGFRKVCRCHSLRVADPEVIANRHAKRRERERKKAAAA